MLGAVPGSRLLLKGHGLAEPVLGARLRARGGAADRPADVAARVDVESFDGLTVEFCRRRGANFVVRGLRAISDFEAELQMAHMNRKLDPLVDTVFFMSALEHSYLSSSLVKEIAIFGGDVTQMVPAAVARRLAARMSSL